MGNVKSRLPSDLSAVISCCYQLVKDNIPLSNDWLIVLYTRPEEELQISKQIAAELAKDLVEVGFYDEAEANMRRVALSYENMDITSYVEKTEVHEVLASVQLKQGKYNDAEEVLNCTLRNHLARLGRDHPTTQ
ncbi:hypothetical protein M434DRAFT_28270 [Hypoxylon sp. CO27-5]|nr:hypothetical protein M434DRAFT_28270 [Hypoxylon sp. CO27-5]